MSNTGIVTQDSGTDHGLLRNRSWPDLDDSMGVFSQDSLRLRKARFPGDDSLDEDEGLDDGTDVLMTPAESELDENESASSR